MSDHSMADAGPAGATAPDEHQSDPRQVARRLRQGNLAELLLAGGAEPVLRHQGRELTRAQLRAEAERVAGGLRRLGLQPGDRVALYAANSLDWVRAYLGAVRNGSVVVAMNPAYRAAEVAHIVGDAEPAVMLADATTAGLAEAAHRRVVRLEELPEDEPPPLPRLDADSPGLILYTSGTTGRPKGALLDHGNFLAQARGVIQAWRWAPADRLVHALPLFHLHGLGMGLHGTLLSGASATLIGFSPEAVVEELTSGGGTMFFGVPAMYQRLCEWLEGNPHDLGHVRLFVSGSAPLPPALFERCARLLGQPPVERYGITEGGIVVSNPYQGPRVPGRVGFPLPGVEVRLGERDEILLRGGQVFKGYWRNPEATREALTEDGFLHTGDVGEIDAPGSLAIRGRIKELIISGGFNVYPREVELVLEAHPAVAEVAVAGVPSERWGEEVLAFVKPAPGAFDAEELIAFARSQLAVYKCPRRVVPVAELPRNAMGKVDRLALVRGLGEGGAQPV